MLLGQPKIVTLPLTLNFLKKKTDKESLKTEKPQNEIYWYQLYPFQIPQIRFQIYQKTLITVLKKRQT